MINLRNLGSKQSLVVKFKDGILAELCLKLWFESDLIFLKYYWVRVVSKANVQKQSYKQSLP